MRLTVSSSPPRSIMLTQSRSRIPELRALTKRLTGRPMSSPMSHMVEQLDWDVERGSAVSYGVLSRGDVSACLSELAAGTLFDKHINEGCKEIFIVVSGRLKVLSEGQSEGLLLGPSDMHSFDSCDSQSIEVLEDTTLLAVGIPPISGHPKGIDV